jgi:hypothetical protein
MKQITLLAAIVLLTLSSYAQAPQKMSYQAVIRNSSNTLITSSSIGIRISIVRSSATIIL